VAAIMTKLIFTILLSSTCFGVFACSSNSSPPANTVTGTVNKVSLAAVSAVGSEAAIVTSTVQGQQRNVPTFNILISNKENTCGRVHAQGSTSLSLEVPADNSGAPGTGTFTVGPANPQSSQKQSAAATFNVLDSACHDTVAQTATSGKITVDEVVFNVTNPPDSYVSGSFDVTFPGGHLTGNFHSVFCQEAAHSADSGVTRTDGGTGTPACAP
jgi:hypothetical protein